MPIDVARVVGADLPESHTSWGPDDVILYHLALGAGDPPTAPGELAYTYERGLRVLPTFGVLPVMSQLLAMLDLPGMDADLTRLLHGEQDLEVHEPLPARADVATAARVTGVFDKGSAALVVLEAVTRDAGDGRPLCTNRVSLFLRGEGGCGAPGGPEPEPGPPARRPDRLSRSTTLPQQALLYRLTGDRNPLHADPEFAARGGFDRPILHGLGSYGVVCKAVVDAMLGGDPTSIARYRARFAGVVFPGETIEVAIWEEPSRLALTARCVERDTPVLSHAAITLH